MSTQHTKQSEHKYFFDVTDIATIQTHVAVKLAPTELMVLLQNIWQENFISVAR